MTRLRWLLIVSLLSLPVACGDDATVPHDAGTDAGALAHDGGADAGLVLDGGSDAGGASDDGGASDGGGDGGGGDAGPGIVGTISGLCGELDDVELLGASPFYFENRMDFPMGFSDPAERDRLSAGAQEILADGTAGGSSGLSEAFSFEVLHRCEGAVLIKTETEVAYDPVDSKKTDILVEIDGHRIGVSVTRAFAYPPGSPYPVSSAYTLLDRKLDDIVISSANVVPEDAWVKQILHVIAYDDMHADSIMAAWEMLDAATRADTILWVTVSDGDDAFLY